MTMYDDIEFDETAFSEGEAARKAGAALQDCPYRQAGLLRASWKAGWADADMQLMKNALAQPVWKTMYLPGGGVCCAALI